MTFFSLYSTAISSILYGIVITAALMAILYFILKTISNGLVRSFVFYITGVIMAILLIVQFSLMIGAMQAKDAADSAQLYMNQLLENSSGIVGAKEIQQTFDDVIEHFPIIGSFIGLADFSGNNVSQLPDLIHKTMISFLNSYIWHRLLWIFCIIVISCIIVVLFERKKSTIINFDSVNDSADSIGGLQF